MTDERQKGKIMNEHKFSGKADIYAKYRPAYPDAFLEYLYSQAGFQKDSVIADIGSGTGIFTRLLLGKGSLVYGVEPNEDMRKAAGQELAEYKNYICVPHTAESTGLNDRSIDFITAAQAFHWFDREKFKTECKRILKENGKVVLVWNCRDMNSEFVQKCDALNRKYCPDYKGFAGGMKSESPQEYSDFFKDGICDYKVFQNDLTFDLEGFIGRSMSASYAPKPGTESYEPYVSQLKQLFEKYGSSGRLRMPNLTRAYIGTV
jgi:SAM-dependent methyltransferase